MPRHPLVHYLVALLALACIACGTPERRPPAHESPRASFRGTVVGISDGDTLTVLDAERVEHRVRLAGIDAPERGQPFSRNAKESLSAIALGKIADVEWSTRDRYGRVVGKVMLPDPECPTRDCPNTFDAGVGQLTRGSAWWYRRYAGEQSPAERRAYEIAEHEARSRRLGVWSEPAPIPPWDWRRENESR
ncbi:MAG: thermonuclease family protein [Thermoanaerobaculia bacterium]|nr:thermonuclease family protein [Thermoanaerobaculia bacterium]